MNILALDIGLKRTGAAFADDSIGVALSLPTLQHAGIEGLVEPVQKLLAEKNIQYVVLGLPLLLSGEEGKQCNLVRQFADLLPKSLPYCFIDERYTSFQKNVDTDASAATQLLLTYLDQKSAL